MAIGLHDVAFLYASSTALVSFCAHADRVASIRFDWCISYEGAIVHSKIPRTSTSTSMKIASSNLLSVYSFLHSWCSRKWFWDLYIWSGLLYHDVEVRDVAWNYSTTGGTATARPVPAGSLRPGDGQVR
jgi:hypothetical protein